MKVEDWGEIDYEVAVERQLETLNRVSSGEEDTLVFCTHPSVVTLGRASKERDLFGWTGPVVEASRGGRITYHGPSQVVVYPILNLQKKDRRNIPVKDLHNYLRALEKAIIGTLNEWGVNAHVKNDKVFDEAGDELLMTGVWVDDRKLASLGVVVKKWVTYHGLALNLDDDPKAFSGINPCGFPQKTMVSLQELIGEPIQRNDFSLSLKIFLVQALS